MYHGHLVVSHQIVHHPGFFLFKITKRITKERNKRKRVIIDKNEIRLTSSDKSGSGSILICCCGRGLAKMVDLGVFLGGAAARGGAEKVKINTEILQTLARA